ncbi:unnamed protein product [Paramecium sonneborni]|uniref:Uncharacterized protein n=1 Tax=Paramecium sonneborni TaxID=65129 RepID=A0A8S1N4Y5_9CILI|nr:unnamed protein product [Paramecium sonneborni]
MNKYNRRKQSQKLLIKTQFKYMSQIELSQNRTKVLVKKFQIRIRIIKIRKYKNRWNENWII